MGRKWLKILQRSKRPREDMEEEGLEELRRRAQEATSGKLREVAAQDPEEVRESREERWEMSADLAKLMKAAYTLYPAAASISRFRGETQWKRTELRGGDQGPCCQGDNGPRERRRSIDYQDKGHWAGASRGRKGRRSRDQGSYPGEGSKKWEDTDQEVSHWYSPMRVEPINPDSCGAVALALVWCPLPRGFSSSGLCMKGNMDKGQVDTGALQML